MIRKLVSRGKPYSMDVPAFPYQIDSGNLRLVSPILTVARHS
jgi:hypothetical protein